MMMKTNPATCTNRVGHWVIPVLLAGALSACSSDNGRADAYGNFEATEVIVSAAATGRILSFVVEEGQIVEQGSHEELLELGGLYRDLYERQFIDSTFVATSSTGRA